MSEFVKSIETGEAERIILILRTEDGKLHYVSGARLPESLYPLTDLETSGYYEVMSFPWDGEKVIDWTGELQRNFKTWSETLGFISVLVEGLENYLESEKEDWEGEL